MCKIRPLRERHRQERTRLTSIQRPWQSWAKEGHGEGLEKALGTGQRGAPAQGLAPDTHGSWGGVKATAGSVGERPLRASYTERFCNKETWLRQARPKKTLEYLLLSTCLDGKARLGLQQGVKEIWQRAHF